MSSIAEFSAKVDAWLKGVNELTVGVARGVSAEAFELLLQNSPQFSGDFVGNWKYSAGTPDKSFNRLGIVPKRSGGAGPTVWNKLDPFILGDLPAIKVARTLNAGADLELTHLGPTIFISNSAFHTEAYAWMIEDGKIRFREGNHGQTVSITSKSLHRRYGPGISKLDALRLTTKHVGV
jgi:hypothetical protein